MYSGILGIGENTAGPTTTPFEGDGGVLVDIPHGQLVVGGANPFPDGPLGDGDPVTDVFEVGQRWHAPGIGVQQHRLGRGVRNDPVQPGVRQLRPGGDSITVDNAAGDELYSYTTTGSFDVGTRHRCVSDSPDGRLRDQHRQWCPAVPEPRGYLDYASDKTYFDPLTS